MLDVALFIFILVECAQLFVTVIVNRNNSMVNQSLQKMIDSEREDHRFSLTQHRKTAEEAQASCEYFKELSKKYRQELDALKSKKAKKNA